MPVCKFPAFACRDYESFLNGDCFPCKECGNMGYYADQSPGRGQLYLVTRDEHPFCGNYYPLFKNVSKILIFSFSKANQFKIEIWHSGGPPATEAVATQGRFMVTFINQDGKNETIDVSK